MDAETETKFSESNNNIHKEKNDNDDLISSIIGNIGKWQLSIGFMMALLKIPVAMFQFNIVMIAAKQNYWCEKWRDPAENIMNQTSSADICAISNFSDKCETIKYNRSIFTSTIITDWELICSREIYVEITQMIMMFGFLIGCLSGGYFADKLGRKNPLLCGVLLQSVASFLCTFSPTLWFFIISRFFMGLASGAICVVSFVMCIEIVGGKWRAILPIFYHIPYGLGLSFIACISYIYREWRDFHLVISIISLVYILFYWFIPESPRWLFVTGREDKAIEILKKASIINKRNPNIVEIKIKAYSNGRKNYDRPSSTSRTSQLSKKFIILTVYLSMQWFIISLCYYAFILSTEKISSNPFTSLALAGLMTTPGIIFCIYMLRNFGRKTIIFWCQLLVGLSMLCLTAFPKGQYYADWPRMLIVGIVTFLYSIFLPTLYLHCGEIYPTVSRNLGVGIVSTVNRVGGMIAPFLLYTGKVNEHVLYMIMGILMIFALIFLTLLPETKNKSLPDTFEETENIPSKTMENWEKNENEHELLPKIIDTR